MKVKELLTDETKWTKRVFARTAGGFRVSPTNKDATCWCLLGAIERCYPGSQYCAIRDKVIGFLQYPISLWNDSPNRTFKDVKNLVTELDI